MAPMGLNLAEKKNCLHFKTRPKTSLLFCILNRHSLLGILERIEVYT